MNNYDQQQPFSDYTVISSEPVSSTVPAAASKRFMANVFLWMFAGLGLSALSAYLFATTPSLLSLLVAPGGHGLSGLGMFLVFAPIGFVLLMSFGFNRLSAPAMVLSFLLYSIINGVSFSFILLAYAAGSVIGCFLASAAMFGVMAVMGYTTDKDLTSFGRILFMGLIGMIIAIVINLFLGSPMIDMIISLVGVAVFTGLTAYDVQMLKNIGASVEYNGGTAVGAKKMAIMGALRLYLDFINLFLSILRLFGRRN